MKFTFSLLVAFALAAPLAAAGGINASVTYLDAPGAECSQSYSSDGYGNYTYEQFPDGGYAYSGYSYWSSHGHESCREEFTTAGAEVSDDSGSVASARVHGNDTSSSSGSSHQYQDSSSFFRPEGNHSWNGTRSSRWYSSGTFDGAHSNAWHRSADVSAGGQTVKAGRGCSDSSTDAYSRSESSNSHSTPESHSSYQSGSYSESATYRSTCYDGANAAGANAGYLQRCDYESDGDGYYGMYRDSYGSGSHGSDRRASHDECRTGVAAGRGDTTAFAGTRFACSEDSSNRHQNGDEWSSSSRECTNDLVRVEGPDGILVVVGTFSAEDWSCASDGCWSSSYSYGGARLEWARSPLGPMGPAIYQPLP